MSLVKEGKVPEDAAAVLIFAPQKDISEDELQMLRDYGENGGKFICPDGLYYSRTGKSESIAGGLRYGTDRGYCA